MAKNIETIAQEPTTAVQAEPAKAVQAEAVNDNAATIALLIEQMRRLTEENQKLKATEAARHIPRGESLPEKIRLQRTIRMRTWGKDRLGNPKCLTGGEAAQMHVEFGLGNLVLITPNECCKLYGLELDDEGTLLHLGQRIKGTSDAEFAKEMSGGKTLAQRTAELDKRAQVLLNRFGVVVAMPNNNDLDLWEQYIEKAELQSRSPSGVGERELPDFETAPRG